MVCHNCEELAKKHGRDRKGLRRFRCIPCNRTFTEYQEKPLEGMYLPLEKASQIVSMLLEGMSLRSVSRLTGVEMHTILKLLVQEGDNPLPVHFLKRDVDGSVVTYPINMNDDDLLSPHIVRSICKHFSIDVTKTSTLVCHSDNYQPPTNTDLHHDPCLDFAWLGQINCAILCEPFVRSNTYTNF